MTGRWTGTFAETPSAAPCLPRASEADSSWRDRDYMRFASSRWKAGEDLAREERRTQTWVVAQRSHNVLFSRPYAQARQAATLDDDDEIPPLESAETDGGGQCEGDLAAPACQEDNFERIRREALLLQTERDKCHARKKVDEDEKEASRRNYIEEQVKMRKAQLEEQRKRKALEAEVRKLLHEQAKRWKEKCESDQVADLGSAQKRGSIPRAQEHASEETHADRVGKAARLGGSEVQAISKDSSGDEEHAKDDVEVSVPIVEEVLPTEEELKEMMRKAADEEKRRQALIAELREQVYAEENQKPEDERLLRIETRRKRRIAGAEHKTVEEQTQFNIIGMKCPKGHSMVPYVKRVTGPCDECRENIIKGVHLMACSFAPVCDWFLCQKCSEYWERKRRREQEEAG